LKFLFQEFHDPTTATLEIFMLGQKFQVRFLRRLIGRPCSSEVRKTSLQSP